MLLVCISGKRVYRDLEFEEDQREHRAAVQQKLMSLHQDAVAIMTNSYEVFKNDGPEVGVLWPGLYGQTSPPVPADLSLGVPPKYPASLGFTSVFQTFFLRTQHPTFLFNQLVPFSVCWFSFLKTCAVFPEGFPSPTSLHQIQQQWMLYTIRLNHMMEDALRLNVKWSLLELSKAINGDGKTSPNPLFQVLVILQNDMQGSVAQVGTTLPLTPQNYHTLFTSFPQSLNLALGFDFIL